MLKTRLLSCVSTLIFSFFSFVAFAQLVQHCPSNTQPPADNCGDCIYCGFNGIQSSTVGYTADIPPLPGFCGTVENSQFLGFIAGETGGTFSANSTFCSKGHGLELAIYDATCSSVLACSPGSPFGANAPASVSVNSLMPGQTYFLMVDGYLGDSCSFTISVSPNSAIVPPFPQAPDSIAGPTQVCPNITTQYCIPPVDGAAAYVWNAPPGALINGAPGPVTVLGSAGLCVDITWPPNPTAGPIIVNGINSCFTNTPPAILIVHSLAIPPTIEQQPPVCQEDFPFTLAWGTVTVGPGAFNHTYQTAAGCDSMVTHIITPVVVPPTILQAQTICLGDSLTYCGQSFNSSGAFNAICTNVDGCDSLVKVILIVMNIDPTIQGGGTLSCTNPSILLRATPGPGVINWLNSQGQSIGIGDSIYITNPGTYILEASAPTGTTTNCVKRDTIVIGGSLTPPNLSVTGATIGCVGAVQICANSTSNVQYAWSAGATPSNSACPMVSAPGAYIVTVSDLTNGCTSTATATVLNSTDSPALNLSGGTLTCAQSAVQVMASSPVSGVTYLWSTGQTSPSISVSNPGTYTVTISNPTNACTNAQSITINTDYTAPGATISGGTLSCTIASVQLQATSNSSATYLWSTGAAGGTISVNATGSYMVTATGQNGCTSTASFTVNQDNAAPSVVVSAAGNLTCNQSAVVLMATGSAAVTYTWSGPNNYFANGATVNVTQAGSYVVTASASNGCTSSATHAVLADLALPTVSASTQGMLTCTQTSVQLTAQGSVGNSYVWTGPNNFMAFGATASATSAGTYTVLATGTNGCTNSSQVTVQADNQIPQVTATAIGTINCTISSVDLTASSNQTGQFTWTGPGGFSANTAAVSVNNSGTYTVIFSATNGCTGTANTVVVEDFASPILQTAGGVLNCSVPSLPLFASSGVGTSFSWTGPNGFSSNLAQPSVSVSGTYTVTALGSNGCTASESVTVSEDFVQPDLQVSGTILSCDQPSGTIQAVSTTAVQYAWTGPNGFSATTAAPNVSAAGTYSVVVTGANGCTASGTTEVSADENIPMLTLPTPMVLTCCVSEVLLALETTPNTGLSYAWSGGNLNATNQQPTVSTAGTYTVVVTNSANGCSATSSVTVVSNTEIPDLQAEGGILTCSMPSISLSANSNANVTYAWSGPNGFMSNTANPSVDSAGTYTIEVQDLTNCCVASTTVLVVDSCFVSVYSLENKGQIRVYPNATSGQLFVESMTPELLITAVQVQALDGKILISDDNLSTTLHELNLSMYAAGTYLVWAEVGGQRLLFKVLLQ